MDVFSTGSLWALLRVSLLGDPKAALTIARSGELSDEVGSALLPVGLQNGQQQSTAVDGGLLTAAEVGELLLSHAVASMNIWMRLNQLDMASLEVRRYLRQKLMTPALFLSPSTGHMESLSIFLCKSLRCVVDQYVPLSVLPFTSNYHDDHDEMSVKRIGIVFANVHEVLLCLENVVFKNKSTIVVVNAVRSVKLFIDARKNIAMLNMIASSYQSNTTHLHRIQQISESALKSAVAYRDFCHETTSDVGFVHQNSIHDAAVTEEKIEANILVAIALSLSRSGSNTCIKKACEILSQIVLVYENDTRLRKFGLFAGVFLCFLRLYQLTLGDTKENTCARETILVELDRLLAVSRNEMYPKIEQLIVQQFTFLSRL